MGQLWCPKYQFFLNTVLIYKHYNFISEISNSNGNIFNDHSSIQQDFVGFYSWLWSNSSNDNFNDISNALPDNLPKLSSYMCNSITREVNGEEVYNVIIDLPSGKSLGLDILNAEFYHFFWNEIGSHLVSVVQIFFSNSVMPSTWRKTHIVLIPKNR